MCLFFCLPILLMMNFGDKFLYFWIIGILFTYVELFSFCFYCAFIDFQVCILFLLFVFGNMLRIDVIFFFYV
jgi:hypothetical protein